MALSAGVFRPAACHHILVAASKYDIAGITAPYQYRNKQLTLVPDVNNESDIIMPFELIMTY